MRRYLPEGYDLPVLRQRDVVGAESWAASICPICWSGTRTRLALLYLQRETDLFRRETRVLHVAPEMGIFDVLSRAASVSYWPCDLDPTRYFADDIAKVDVTNLDFDDGTFDVVLANHVLEHVEDDARAMLEIWRVLEPGGWAMLQVPISLQLTGTYEDPSLRSPADRERAFGQHDHVRLYACDYPDRLRAAGFEVEIYDVASSHGSEIVDAWLLNPREKIYVARKPLANTRP